MEIITRFSPSPTGYLHLGGLRTALYSYAFAKKLNGKFLLRIEDTDQKRFVKGSDTEILDMLKLFGINWDNEEIIYQSKRLQLYKEYALRLVNDEYAYYCFCNENDSECQCHKYNKRSEYNQLLYMIQTIPYTIKLRMPKDETIIFHDELRGDISINTNTLYDIVLIKSDGGTTYHLASVVDDHLSDVSHVFRGEEWISSTPYHIYLYKCFMWNVPKFIHLPLILNTDKSKLSKRNNDVSVKSYIDKGYLKEAIINYIAQLGYISKKEFFTLDEFVNDFATRKLSLCSGCFDIDKLNFYNRHYMKLLSDEQILHWFDREYAPYGLNNKTKPPYIQNAITMCCGKDNDISSINLLRNSCNTLHEILVKCLDLHTMNYKIPISEEDLDIMRQYYSYKAIKALYSYIYPVKVKPQIITNEVLNDIIQSNNIASNKEFHPPIRIALTHNSRGCPIDKIIKVLGIRKTVERLDKWLYLYNFTNNEINGGD